MMSDTTLGCAQSNLVVGIGSPHGWDRIGWLVAEELQHRLSTGWQVRLARVPTDLLDWLEHCDRLHLIDACEVPSPTGSLLRLEWPDSRILQSRTQTAHDFDLPQVLQLADRLGQLPKQVVLWAVEVEPTNELGPPSNRVTLIASTIEKDVRRHA